MEVLEFSGLPHNKAPFLTVGGFLFSVPDSSHWADHLHDERTEAASSRSRTNKDGPRRGGSRRIQGTQRFIQNRGYVISRISHG